MHWTDCRFAALVTKENIEQSTHEEKETETVKEKDGEFDGCLSV